MIVEIKLRSLPQVVYGSGAVKSSKAVDLMEVMENKNPINLVDSMDSMDFRDPAT